MSTAAVFFGIEKAFDTTWHSGLLYKLSKLEFSTSLFKLVSSFLSQRKFSVSVEGEMSTLREMQAGVPQGSLLSPTLYNMYINRFYRVLTMVYNTQNCWGFGLYPSSGF
jgi:retron-type reverse transcriptase